jgi:NTE family protein
VSRAVTASSAVPILFDPVVIKNFDGCLDEAPRWLQRAKQRSGDNAELMLTVNGLESYFDREKHRYAHFVDGGITDNLGLRAIYDMTQLTGDGRSFLAAMKVEPAPRLVVISVDASTQPDYKMGLKEESPDVFSTISAMTDIQLHRYNTATVNEMQRSLKVWAEQISTDQTDVEVFFIRLNFDSLEGEAEREYINEIPTSLNLSDKQVDAVIGAGRRLLRNNTEFQRLVTAINTEAREKWSGENNE